MEAGSARKFKTSISLPTDMEATWHKRKKMLLANLGDRMRQMRKFNPHRLSMRRYNRQAAGDFLIIQVYWTHEQYHTLHAMAHALKLSVSYLIAMILAQFETGSCSPEAGPERRVFSNYAFRVRAWDGDSMIYSEILRFTDSPPC